MLFWLHVHFVERWCLSTHRAHAGYLVTRWALDHPVICDSQAPDTHPPLSCPRALSGFGKVSAAMRVKPPGEWVDIDAQ